MELGFVQGYKNARYENYARFARWAQRHETLVRFGAAFLMAVLTAGLAQITIHTPLTPVPFTMQVLGISLMGGLLGRRWGTVSACLYLGLGLVGLPVFAGQAKDFHAFRLFGGFAIFPATLSAWYLVGFVAQAHVVGWVARSRTAWKSRALLLAPVAALGLVAFALLDAYFLSDYASLYQTSAFPNAWFLVLSLGILVIVGAVLWLALTHKARRERIELFVANILGLLVLYLVGAIGFYFVWHHLDYGELTMGALLAFAVLPFIPVDIGKILAAIGILTLLRPTDVELDARGATRTPPEAVA